MPCRGARRCRGRLIVRLTPRSTSLHARIHAPGNLPIRAISLTLPTSLPAASAQIVPIGRRVRGTVAELNGRVRVVRGFHRRVLTLTRLPAGTRTVLLRLRVPPAARATLLRAGCRRARVDARLVTTGGTRALAARLYAGRADCRGQ